MKKAIKLIIIIIISILLCTTVVFAENETTEDNNTNTTAGENEVKEEITEPTKEEEKEEPKQEEEKKEEKQEEEKEETNTELKQEEKVETPTNTNQNTKKEETVTKKEETKSATKSSNADLGNLGITPYDFSGFVSSITKYNVSVPNSVKSVEVYAKAKDISATISGTGKIELKEGQNTATVDVTAEDGTQKTYTIVITRLKEGEKLGETRSSSGICLKSIKIEGLELNEKFEEGKFDYTVNYEGEETSLKITAEANQTSGIVQILGNENLVDGANKVIILVSDAQEENSAIYQITVKKNFQKAIDLENERNWEKIKQTGLLILVAVVLIALIIVIIVKHRRNHEEEEQKELPKSLRKSNNKSKVKSSKQNNKKHGKHGR